jgi:DNA polymerase delta subunit 1
MFGVDSNGASVAAFVHGFDPYFYVEAPPNFGPDDCEGLCRSLNVS